MTVTELFGAHAAEFRRTALSDEVVHHAKRVVIDWYASLFPGLATEPVRLLEATLADDLDRGGARLAFGRLATARTAALINGAAAHAAEIDDSFRDAMYHPGAATVAAALAVAQETGASGLEFLRAVVLGYEISTRIGVVMGRPHYTYWHSTGTIGTFGAAAVAAYLYGLEGRPFAHALATAATFAAGLQQAFRMDSMSKPLHPGRAAEGGVLAAQLAARGVTGSLDVLEGDSGLGKAMSDGPDWSRIGETLGRDFHITRMTFKNHIGCGHTFAAIDGALALQRAQGIRAERIARVRVGTYRPALDIACYLEPTTANEARFSLKYVVATALVHGSVRLAAYAPARLDDPATRALMARIEVAVDPELDAAFPGKRAARIEIELDSGERHSYFQPNRKGDPEAPLSDAELEDKMLELATPVIGSGAAQALLERLRVLDTVPALDW
ncbi:MmgE/PrpD family protein [Denitromonas iodatirespirans]|uniref:MmgE/PrpD family protein n=1 Tax=Denitromonas iodatirespirans TaxID=2795389 RepID=A0A944DF29_DENI1|nr:MmgE/PrpD family protein [Denitromonas iodatirespirans]MBT0961638.1 MmgE/PrpD family protein [Denitromonas iodatirespirans]